MMAVNSSFTKFSFCWLDRSVGLSVMSLTCDDVRHMVSSIRRKFH